MPNHRFGKHPPKSDYTQEATWGWWDECVDEAYALLPPEAEKAGFSPGFDFAQLQSDLADVAS